MNDTDYRDVKRVPLFSAGSSYAGHFIADVCVASSEPAVSAAATGRRYWHGDARRALPFPGGGQVGGEGEGRGGGGEEQARSGVWRGGAQL